MPDFYTTATQWKFLVLVLSLLLGTPGYGQSNSQSLATQAPEASLAVARSASSAEIYNTAVHDFVVALQRQYPPAYWKTPLIFGSYRVSASSPSENSTLWDPSFFDALVPGTILHKKHLRHQIRTYGQGVPFVGFRQATADRMSADPFLSEAGMACPLTIILKFTNPKQPGAPVDVKIDIVNPKRSDAALAADYSAPLELLMTEARTDHFIRQGLLRPLESANITGLYMLEPYQSDRIPVVMVHGLDSSPRTWLNTYNELMADPVIRNRYQFWFFRYPTGNPVLLSAARLREGLQQVRAYSDPTHKDSAFNHMVVVGHSMGGLLTRLLVTESGEAFWRGSSNIHFEVAALASGDREILQRILLFQPQPFISRVVFISTPHRGSDLAAGSVAKIANNMISMPFEVTGIAKQPALNSNGAVGRLNSLKIPTGIDNLKPTSPMIQTLQSLPVQVPHHSIVGNNGVTWHGAAISDGVVPYQSSFLASADSEVIVPSDHSAHAHPLAVAELNRILRLHLQSAP